MTRLSYKSFGNEARHEGYPSCQSPGTETISISECLIVEHAGLDSEIGMRKRR